jgi:APA family basic amino acid/polyamine antiporter
MIVTGGIIGSGIFIVTADISRTVVSPGYMLLVWVISGFLTMVGAISYGELSSMFPNVGGQYVYLKEAYNKMVAFLYGWTLFPVIQTGVIAAVAVAFARFTGVLLPWVSEGNVQLRAGGLEFTSVQLLAIGSIIYLTYINSRGVASGAATAGPIGTSLLSAFGIAMVGALFSADSWNNIGFSGDEVVNPKRTIVLSM